MTAPTGRDAALRAVTRYALAALEDGATRKLLLAAVDEAVEVHAENAADRPPQPAPARRTRPATKRCRSLPQLAQAWAALREDGHSDDQIAARLGYQDTRYMQTRIREAREAGLLPGRAA